MELTYKQFLDKYAAMFSVQKEKRWKGFYFSAGEKTTFLQKSNGYYVFHIGHKDKIIDNDGILSVNDRFAVNINEILNAL